MIFINFQVIRYIQYINICNSKLSSFVYFLEEVWTIFRSWAILKRIRAFFLVVATLSWATVVKLCLTLVVFETFGNLIHFFLSKSQWLALVLFSKTFHYRILFLHWMYSWYFESCLVFIVLSFRWKLNGIIGTMDFLRLVLRKCQLFLIFL